MTTVTHDDPMTAAMNATKEPKERAYFGEVITVDSWFCVLQKGVGKRPWDSTHDDVKDRRVVIKIEIQPLRGEYTVSQECLTFEKVWIDHTMPSLIKLRADLHALRGKYAQVRRALTGEQYTNKQDQLKEKTAIEFVAIYDTQDACQAAADTFFGERTAASNGAYAGMPEAELPDPAMPPEQQFALNALPALWKASGNDKTKFAALLGQNPLISKYYPIDHPHVVGLIGGAIDDLFPEKDDLL